MVFGELAVRMTAPPLLVHFKEPAEQPFRTIKQDHSAPLPVAGDVIDVQGVDGNWHVLGRYLIYGRDVLREVVIFVRRGAQ